MTAKDLVASRENIELMTIDKNDTIANAFKLISENNFSQLPVTAGDRIVGSVFENLVFNKIMESPETKNEKVESIMQEALPFVDITTDLESLSKMMSPESSAVLVKDFKTNANFIITRYDIAEAMAK
jgi:cystathionine beta-synthase